ncbi:UDP-glucosyltransferase 2-like [Sitodiplosis mosellana]|uniref:UDP-glucosyltransferase 2-like n=1 Tax=Sitodiplosis mosellana TaxID=263140 RepID=UPI002444A4DF|nr:UDP-glucosyltransferase 2-like [Sitodiplosis mosellana]
MNLRIFAFLCALATTIHGYNVLVMVPINGKSHWNYMEVFVKELINRGHQVTCITSITISGPKPDNYTEILIDPPFNLQNIIKHEDMFSTVSDSPFKTAAIFPMFANMSTDYALSSKNVQEFIKRTDLYFDLVINEEIYHDVFLMFGKKFNAPVVTICPYGIANFFDYDMGLTTPLSHISHTMLTFTDKMDFSQRWYNAMLSLYDYILHRFIHISAQTKILKRHFGHMEPLPSIDELRKNISLIFVNAHRSITYPRPSMPGLIFIGGAHIKPPKPLPNNIQQFLDEAKHGVIYFSLGTVVNTSKMPKEKLQVFLDTFRRLKQRVIWKLENESIPNLPKNVMVKKWLPQTDILAHKNIVLFISHGGMFSNFEAINYGHQLLVIPFVGDQYRNAIRVASTGYGKFMDFRDITNESLYGTINEMLTDDVYSKKAKEISAIFRENQVHPMDDFIWWIEYVIKFRGAKHLKSVAADMPLFSYLLLDVILVNLFAVSAVIFGVYFFINRVLFRKKSIALDKKQQ